MTCTPNGFGFSCSRGPMPRCSVTGCRRPGRYACEYPLRGAGRPRCDVPLCGPHRMRQGDGRDYCPVHDKIARPELPNMETR